MPKRRSDKFIEFGNPYSYQFISLQQLIFGNRKRVNHSAMLQFRSLCRQWTITKIIATEETVNLLKTINIMSQNSIERLIVISDIHACYGADIIIDASLSKIEHPRAVIYISQRQRINPKPYSLLHKCLGRHSAVTETII